LTFWEGIAILDNLSCLTNETNTQPLLLFFYISPSFDLDSSEEDRQ